MADVALAVIAYLLQLLNFPLPIPKDAGSVVSLIGTLSTLLSRQNMIADFEINPNPSGSPQVYDFIIVGGGTGGAVIANRLSANPKYSVLLLEAGGDPTILNSIPGLATYNLFQNYTDWFYESIPTKTYGFGKANNVAKWASFKGLGGCSAHNFMLYNRGHPMDFDNWGKLTGDPSWEYDQVLEYFKKIEDYDGKFPNEKYHGKGGPYHISNDIGFLPSIEPFNAAAKELGYQLGKDFNSRQEQSFGRVDLMTTKDGRRVDTFNAYIKPILHRPNFKVIRYAHVHQIHIDDNRRATGVTYKRNAELIEAKVKREVIVSAGAIGSPKLLMLSGIGPADHLKSAGVTPKVDLPGVGSGMEDHATALVGPFLFDTPVSFMPQRDMKMEDAEEYASKGTGLFATNGLGSLGYISSSVVEDRDWSDIQVFQFNPGMDPGTFYALDTLYGLKEGLWESWLGPYVGRDGHFGAMNVARPKSTGTIRLASSNPVDKPLIDPGYFSDLDDLHVQIDGMKFLVNLYENTTAWRKHGARLVPTPFPGCENVEFKSDAYWECLARSVTTTLSHPCCTCKMGKGDDRMTVVDTRLRVKNVRGLRVVDASVMPKITNANINTPILMIAEKTADMILQDLHLHENTCLDHQEL